MADVAERPSPTVDGRTADVQSTAEPGPIVPGFMYYKTGSEQRPRYGDTQIHPQFLATLTEPVVKRGEKQDRECEIIERICNKV
ncbi:hypothetical protein Q1695_014018 [Nippostrongylus brasiliensis]|nr:hypothetical protein Q1695_014018 [Nippostrongylus brasiliensis]